MRPTRLESSVDLGDERVLLYCGGSSWDAPPGTDHHLATHLAAHLPVIYVDPAESVASQARAGRTVDIRSSLEQVDERVFRLRPRSLPGVTRPLLRALAARQTRRAIRRLVGTLDLHVAAQIVATMDDVFVPGLSGPRILYGTDDFVAGAPLMGLSRRWVLRREPQQLAAATCVLAVSEVIAQRWIAQGHDVSVLPNGCDAVAFASTPATSPADDLHVPAPRAVVVGQLSERLDLRLLDALASTGRSLVLVGPAVTASIAGELEELASRPNVQWVGRVSFATLPHYLAAASVGLTPYADNAFNRASFPLKTLEYLAAGLPVVSTDLPAARALDTTHVTLAPDVTSFVEATAARLDDEVTAEDVRARQELATAHSWPVRAAELMGHVDAGV